MSPISDDLSQIKKATSELNAVATEATARIREVDKLLAEADCGIEWIEDAPLHDGFDIRGGGAPEECVYYLGYGRADSGAFSLIIQRVFRNRDDDGDLVRDRDGDTEWEPVDVIRAASASRTLRLKVLARLPHFLSALRVAVEAQVAEAKAVLPASRAAADEMKGAAQVAYVEVEDVTPPRDPQVAYVEVEDAPRRPTGGTVAVVEQGRRRKGTPKK